MGAKNKLSELDDRGFLLHMRDLKLAYRQTYWQLRRSLKEAESVNKDERGKPMEHSDIRHLKEAISDVNFAITWMHTGKQPGVKRGIERRSAYQREKLMDPVRMQAFMSGATAGSPANLTEWQRTQIEDALCRLSPQERVCYEMKHGQGFSFRYIASMMGIKASTVENYVVRAQKSVFMGWGVSSMIHISSYSGGGASWYTSELLAERFGKENVINLFADTMIEDEDTYRFITETTMKSGIRLVRVADGRDPWDVFKDNRWIGNSQVAPCSTELKQKMCRIWVKNNYEPDECIIYVGIDWTEIHRMKAIQDGWKPYRAEAVLTEPPYIDKEFIFSKMAEQGIRKPRLYEMGFSHNNCGGFCVRAGKGHFINLLLKMPERYLYHEGKEQEMRDYLERDDISILSNQVFSHYEVKEVKETEDGNQSKMFDQNELGIEKEVVSKKTAVYVKQPYTLRQLREDWENGLGSQIDLDDIGGCGCFAQ